MTSSIRVGNVDVEIVPPEISACGKCGRPLQDPISVARGIGPKCFAGAPVDISYYNPNQVDLFVRDFAKAAEREIIGDTPGYRFWYIQEVQV